VQIQTGKSEDNIGVTNIEVHEDPEYDDGFYTFKLYQPPGTRVRRFKSLEHSASHNLKSLHEHRDTREVVEGSEEEDTHLTDSNVSAMFVRKLYNAEPASQVNLVAKVAKTILDCYYKSNSEALVVVDGRDAYSNMVKGWMSDHVFLLILSHAEKDVTSTKNRQETAGVVAEPFSVAIETARQVIIPLIQKSGVTKVHFLAATPNFRNSFIDINDYRPGVLQFYRDIGDLNRCVDKITVYNGPDSKYNLSVTCLPKTNTAVITGAFELEEDLGDLKCKYKTDGVRATLKVVWDYGTPSVPYNLVFKAFKGNIVLLEEDEATLKDVKRILMRWNTFCDENEVDAKMNLTNDGVYRPKLKKGELISPKEIDYHEEELYNPKSHFATEKKEPRVSIQDLPFVSVKMMEEVTRTPEEAEIVRSIVGIFISLPTAYEELHKTGGYVEMNLNELVRWLRMYPAKEVVQAIANSGLFDVKETARGFFVRTKVTLRYL